MEARCRNGFEIVSGNFGAANQPQRVNIDWFLRRRRCIPKPRVAAPAAHPGSMMPRGSETPTGFYKRRMPRYQSFAQHEHRRARRAIVQPRWGNHIAAQRITRGTRRAANPGFGMQRLRRRFHWPYRSFPIHRVHDRLDARSIDTYRSTSNWFLRRRRCIPKPRVAAPAAHPGYTMPRGIQTPTGFYKRGMPCTNRARNTNTAMNVGRLSNPVGVTISPRNALPGVRGVAANPGFGMQRLRRRFHRPYRSLPRCRSIEFTGRSIISNAEGVRFHSPGSPRQRRTLAARIRNPNGVLQTRDAAYQSCAQHEHRRARRAIVQPRWGNHIAALRITRGTRRCREPRVLECNAFGVGSIGHIVRCRDVDPSSSPVDPSGT